MLITNKKQPKNTFLKFVSITGIFFVISFSSFSSLAQTTNPNKTDNHISNSTNSTQSDITNHYLDNNSIYQFDSPNNKTKIYTWKDKKGIVHYGDGQSFPIMKKIHVKNKFLETQEPTGTKSDKTKNIKSNSQNEFSKKDNSSTPLSNNEKLAPDKKTACQIAQSNVELLSNTSKLAYTRDKNGNPVILQGKNRKESLKKAQNRANLYCH